MAVDGVAEAEAVGGVCVRDGGVDRLVIYVM